MRAKTINWTTEADNEFTAIRIFWNNYHLSTSYSKKLRDEVRRIEQIILDFPESFPIVGDNMLTGIKVHRAVVQENFSLFYQIENDAIFVISFRDNRRDPQGLTHIINFSNN